MNWKALKENKCPLCGESLKHNARYYSCSSELCEFMCSVRKFSLMTSGKGTDMFATFAHQNIEENLSELNNL